MLRRLYSIGFESKNNGMQIRKKDNFQLGRFGEQYATDYLRNKKYRLLEKNFRNRFGEIDLIFEKKGKIIFVEVKLKIGDEFGTPEEMITKGKILQIEKTARAFLMMNQKLADKFPIFQIDAVCILFDKGGEFSRISHHENIGGDI